MYFFAIMRLNNSTGTKYAFAKTIKLYVYVLLVIKIN